MDEDAWDDICTNPHQEHLDKGRQEGLEAGRVSGFSDGSALGIVKGIEFGLELGFISEYCRSLQAQHSQNDKALLEIQSVMDLLQAFPQPNQLFNNEEEEQNQTKANNQLQKENLQEHMQRIRNKLKLVMIRFNQNSVVTLKSVLHNQPDSSKETAMDW